MITQCIFFLIPIFIFAAEPSTTPEYLARFNILLNVQPDVQHKNKYIMPEREIEEENTTSNDTLKHVYIFRMHETHLHPTVYGTVSSCHITPQLKCALEALDPNLLIYIKQISNKPPITIPHPRSGKRLSISGLHLQLPTPDSIFAELKKSTFSLILSIAQTLHDQGIKTLDLTRISYLRKEYNRESLHLLQSHGRDVFTKLEAKHKTTLTHLLQQKTHTQKRLCALQLIEQLPLATEAQLPLMYCVASGDLNLDHIQSSQPFATAPQIPPCYLISAQRTLLFDILNHSTCNQAIRSMFEQKLSELINQRHIIRSLLAARVLAFVSGNSAHAHLLFPAQDCLSHAPAFSNEFVAKLMHELPKDLLEKLNKDDIFKQVFILLSSSLLLSAPTSDCYFLKLAFQIQHHIEQDPSKAFALKAHIALSTLSNHCTNKEAYPVIKTIYITLLQTPKHNINKKTQGILANIENMVGLPCLPMNETYTSSRIQDSKILAEQYKDFNALILHISQHVGTQPTLDVHKALSQEQIEEIITHYTASVVAKNYLLFGNLQYFNAFATGKNDIILTTYGDTLTFLQACSDLALHQAIALSVDSLNGIITHMRNKTLDAALPHSLHITATSIAHWSVSHGNTTPSGRNILLKTLAQHLKSTISHLAETSYD